jgi:hypothetical protein
MTQTAKKHTNESISKMHEILEEIADAHNVLLMWYAANAPDQYTSTVLRILLRATRSAHLFLEREGSPRGEAHNNTEGQNGRAHH